MTSIHWPQVLRLGCASLALPRLLSWSVHHCPCILLQETLTSLEQEASQKVADNVQLIVEPSSPAMVSKALGDTFLGKLRGDAQKKVMIMMDNKVCSQGWLTCHAH